MSETVSKLREWRNAKKLNLDEACELFVAHGYDKPSTAKLSRIERDQDIPLEMVPALEKITGIPAKELLPEIAKLFEGAAP